MPEPEEVGESTIPTDFAEYEHWRNTGELPGKKEEEPPAAEGEKPEAKPAPDSDPDTKQETTEEAPPPGVQKRIDKAIAKQRDAERRAAEAERRLAEIQGSRPAIEKTAESAAAPLEEPQASAFETYDAYVRALTRFELKNELKLEREAEKKAEQEKSAQAEARKAQDAWDERRAKVSEKYTDWEDVVGAAAIPVSQALHDALLTSEHGPEIAYQLAKDPAEAKRLNTLSPLEQIRTVGRLEAKFEASPEPERPKVSKAPKPPTPITGGVKSSAPDIHDETLATDYVAWEKVRNAQLRRR
jgi:hypothetical protein